MLKRLIYMPDIVLVCDWEKGYVLIRLRKWSVTEAEVLIVLRYLADYSGASQKQEVSDSWKPDTSEQALSPRQELEIPSSTQTRRKLKAIEAEDCYPESARIEYALYRLAAAQEDRNEIFRELTTYIKRYLEQ